jgi:phosphoribosylglycinamide formyltransferase-1
MMRPRVAILASGEGTTAEAFIKACAENKIFAQADLVICNNENAGIFNRVAKLNKRYGLNVSCKHISKKNFPISPNENLKPGEQTIAEESAILETLENGQFDLIILMGYMKKIRLRLVRRFGWRQGYKSPYQAMMLNTHPGLLPATKGLYGIYVQEYVLSHKLKYAGQTLHIVAEDYDDGPIVAEHKIEVREDDTPDSLFERVKQTEKKYIAEDIESFITARKKYLSEKET